MILFTTSDAAMICTYVNYRYRIKRSTQAQNLYNESKCIDKQYVPWRIVLEKNSVDCFAGSVEEYSLTWLL